MFCLNQLTSICFSMKIISLLYYKLTPCSFSLHMFSHYPFLLCDYSPQSWLQIISFLIFDVSINFDSHSNFIYFIKQLILCCRDLSFLSLDLTSTPCLDATQITLSKGSLFCICSKLSLYGKRTQSNFIKLGFLTILDFVIPINFANNRMFNYFPFMVSFRSFIFIRLQIDFLEDISIISLYYFWSLH